jgi:hypothetical protein
VVHRDGEAYRNFRAAVAAENLLDGYPDMRFWSPTGVGFLTRSPVDFTKTGPGDAKDFIVIQDLSPRVGAKTKVLESLRAVAALAEAAPVVGSFWVLEREDGEDGDDVVVFSRFESEGGYEGFMAGEGRMWKSVDELCEDVRTTTWVESGIGYISR